MLQLLKRIFSSSPWHNEHGIISGMNLTSLPVDIEFWDRFAPAYEKWLSRCIYHRPLVNNLAGMIESGWKVLDIGAATGVLSFPLAALGCTVEAIEPSKGMRQIFAEKISTLRTHNITIVPVCWEEYHEENRTFDLAVACNSLHLTAGGLAEGMRKVFATGASQVCLITEINQRYFIDFKHIDSLQNTHIFLSIRNYRLDSSYYFETSEEVLDLEELLSRTIPAVMMNGLPVWRDSSDVAVVWWQKKQ